MVDDDWRAKLLINKDVGLSMIIVIQYRLRH
jgi:hypothetical protein